MNITFSVDWLHVSEQFKPYALLGSFVRQHPIKQRITPDTPRYGYTEGIITLAGAKVMRNINRPDMGIHVSYSGSCLNNYREVGITGLDIIRFHVARQASFSRIDLAFDVFNSPMKVQALHDELNNGKATTTAKAWQIISGNDGGCTLYIGSRQSEAFLRIYDKAAQLGLKEDWIRVELELKASKAQYAAFTMANATDSRAHEWAQAWLKGFVTFNDATYQRLTTQQAITIEKTSKPEKDTRKWLIELVAPAIAKYINKTGDRQVLTEMIKIAHRLSDTSD